MANQVPREILSQLDGVVLASIMRVDLKHVPDEETCDRGIKRWDVFSIISCNDRLSERRRKTPSLGYPTIVEIWIDLADPWRKVL